MDNNVGFISSIKTVSDFEELVRRFVQKIYSADAYLVGGPYDGGRDLAYAIRGKQVREAIQISTQENNLESKINEDLEKVALLVDNHSYPAILHFFWSHPISASKEDNIRTNARTKFGITIEFYDANKIAQKITNDYPELLKFLLEDIHKYSPSTNSDIDIKQRAFYDYLVLSKDTANLKHAIVDSHIVSNLYEKEMLESGLIELLAELGIKPGQAKSRIGVLRKSGRVVLDGEIIQLSEKEIARIKNVEKNDSIRRKEVIDSIDKIATTYTTENISEKIFELIRAAYAASVDIQVSEENFEPPKLQIIRKAISDIEKLLISTAKLDEATAKKASHELVEVSAENEYLSNYCSSRLCINLLNQKKLERYIENKSFFLYLDAPVLIRYMAILRFAELDAVDNGFKTVRNLRESIKALKSKTVRATLEHFEETVRHLENAEKISRFASDELIAEFGDSKNVFFNIYLHRKKKSKDNYNFMSFLDEFIGFEDTHIGSHSKFSALVSCSRNFLELNGIEIKYLNPTSSDDFYEDIARRFYNKTKVRRKYQTIKNDIIACEILGDTTNHCDKNGIGQTPMLITWDSTLQSLRTAFREKNPHDEWLVYMPQRAVERLSMVDLKINSSDLKDGVLALIDEDFFKDSRNSLIDTLGVFLGDDTTESGAVISLLTKLTRRITEEAHDPKHVEQVSYNTLNEILLYTHQEFYTNFASVRKLFQDERYYSEVFDLLKVAITSDFSETDKEHYTNTLKTLITSSEA
ncbi:TPA: hypothetical protein ACWX6S_003907 [Pseudomonas aeruginosa]